MISANENIVGLEFKRGDPCIASINKIYGYKNLPDESRLISIHARLNLAP